jgi:hypothetical protein
VNEVQRVLLPRQRFDFEDSTGVRSLSINEAERDTWRVDVCVDTSRIFTI